MATFMSLGMTTVGSVQVGAVLALGLNALGAPGWPASVAVFLWLWWARRVLGYRVEISPTEVSFHGVLLSGRWPTEDQLAFVPDGLRTTGTGDCLCLELVDGRRIPFRSIFVDSMGWLDFRTDDTVERFEFIRTRIQSGQLRPDSGAE